MSPDLELKSNILWAGKQQFTVARQQSASQKDGQGLGRVWAGRAQELGLEARCLSRRGPRESTGGGEGHI